MLTHRGVGPSVDRLVHPQIELGVKLVLHHASIANQAAIWEVIQGRVIQRGDLGK